jgi:probable biosynthetic protein (TIGR04098 family)
MTTVHSRPTATDDGVTRRLRVTTSMCGGSSGIFAQLGDLTWDTVSRSCGTDVYAARTADGLPAYLSFYYYEVRATEALHPHGLTFGDVLDVTSRCFGFGSESVLTVHRVTRAADLTGADGAAPSAELTAEEFFVRPRPHSLYVQHFNRWITRGRPDSNEQLVVSSPVDFRHSHLPTLPAAYSPRAVCKRARATGGFTGARDAGYRPVGEPFETVYDLDVVHDFNGVGLVYFAAYFSIVDTALARLWRHLGRTDRQFLARRVLGQRMAYFGNADVGARFTITVQLLRQESRPGDEIADVAVRELGTGRLLAVTELRLRAGE